MCLFTLTATVSQDLFTVVLKRAEGHPYTFGSSTDWTGAGAAVIHVGQPRVPAPMMVDILFLFTIVPGFFHSLV
jgi:hypothetical protein